MPDTTQQQCASTNAKRRTSVRGKSLAIEDIILPNFKVAAHGAKDADHPHLPKSLGLHKGHLHVDGVLADHCEVDGDHVKWSRQLDNDEWEHGAVKLTADRLHVAGHVARSNAADSQTHSAAPVALVASVNSIKFDMQVSNEEFAKDKTNYTYATLGTFELGFDDKGHRIGRILDGSLGMVGDDDLAEVFYSSADGHLDVNFSVDPSYFDPTMWEGESHPMPGYISGKAVFSAFFDSFEGTVHKYDANADGFEGKEYAWKAALHKETKKPAAPRLMALAAPTPEVPHPRPAALKSAVPLTLAAQTPLSVTELYSFPVIAEKDLQDHGFKLIRQMMLYSIPQDWNDNLFGQPKPSATFSPFLKGVVDGSADVKTFLKDKLATASLVQGLNGNPEAKKHISDEDAKKVQYYLNSSDKGCLGHDPTYNVVNNQAAKEAFLTLTPRLRDYLADQDKQSNKKYWSDQLWDKLNQPGVLLGLAMQADVEQTLALLRKQSMVLFCLDPNSGRGETLYKTVMNKRAAMIANVFKGVKNIPREYIDQTMARYISIIQNGGDAEMDEGLRKVLQAELTKMNDDQAGIAIKDANEIVNNLSDLVDESVTLMDGVGFKGLDKIAEKLSQKFPNALNKIKFLRGALSFTAYSLAAMSVVQELMAWDTLDTPHKVEAVIGAVSVGMKIISAAPDAFLALKNGIGTLKDKMTFAKVPKEQGIELTEFSRVGKSSEMGFEAVEGASTAIRTEGEAANLSRWSKVASVGSKLMKATNILLLGFGAVMTGLQINEDFNGDPPQPPGVKALDIIQEVSLCVGVITETLGLLMGEAVFSCVPVIGAIFAVIGIVASFVAMCVSRNHHNPPPTESEKFVMDGGQGRTLLNSIPTVPSDWTPPKDITNADTDN